MPRRAAGVGPAGAVRMRRRATRSGTARDAVGGPVRRRTRETLPITAADVKPERRAFTNSRPPAGDEKRAAAVSKPAYPTTGGRHVEAQTEHLDLPRRLRRGPEPGPRASARGGRR